MNRNISNKKIRNILLTAVSLITLFFGSAWVAGTTSPSSTNLKTKIIDTNQSVISTIQPTISTAGLQPSVLITQSTISNPNTVSARVVSVIDGDTIDVNLGGSIKRVRYIGIDTPESVDPRKSIQCFGKEATAKNKELVAGQIVELEKDVSETDRYGRLLRYVYIGDLFINKELVLQGYASAVSYPPDIKYQDVFRQAEQQARSSNKGLWGSCNGSKPEISTSSPTTSQTNTTSGGACKYSCSSPDRDCSDFSSHAEAQTFFNCCGFTAENDPMRLDNIGIGDGVACESLP